MKNSAGRAVLFSLFLMCVFGAYGTPAERPNIVLIMVDDMGWSDIGCYGSEIQTPNIDSLAASGISFRQFYNTSKCNTTRACLLTGVYSHQNGTPVQTGKEFINSVSLGEVLQPVGYHTYISGKHHSEESLYVRGFDHYYGLLGGETSHFNPGTQRPGEPDPAKKPAVSPNYWVDDALIFHEDDPAYQAYFPTNFYSTDTFTEKALEFLDEWEQQDTGRPFFLYLAYTAPHAPLHAWPEDIAKYDGVYDVGFEAIRTNRYQAQVASGLINESQYAISPPVYTNWESLSSLEKEEQASRMEVYAAMVDRVDQKVGDVIAQLQSMGIYDDTLILFCSDNGASKENNEGVAAVNDTNEALGTVGRYSNQQPNWANVSNTPFQYYKTVSDEGGIRTPLIAHWPNGVVNPGRFTDKRGHMVDFMATFLELTGAEYPRFFRGQQVTPLQGESFTDALYDESLNPRSAIYNEYINGSAVIDGDYKLVSRDNAVNFELYNMVNDATELNDLSLAEPATKAAMQAKYDAWWTMVNGNKLPSANDDWFNLTANGGAVSLDVLFNDTDEDIDGSIISNTLVIVRQPVYGSAVVAAGHTVLYTPSGAITSGDSFTYQVEDDDGALSNEGLAQVNFTPVTNPDLWTEAEDAALVTAAITKPGDLVVNGSFENGTTPWIMGSGAGISGANPLFGRSALLVNQNSTATRQVVSTQIGQTYDLSVWINSAGQTGGRLVFDTQDVYDDTCQFVIRQSNGGWVQYTGTFTAISTSLNLRVFSNSGLNGNVYVDGVVVAPVTTASGGWMADFSTSATSDQRVKWEFYANGATSCDLDFGYALASGSYPMELQVNGAVLDPALTLPVTGGWDAWSVHTVSNVTLQAGINTVQLHVNAGNEGPNIDYLNIQFTPGSTTDTDGDEIPDYFENQHASLNRNDPADADEDLDGDGFTNLQEYLAKTDMNDPDSFFAVAIEKAGVGELQVNWPSVQGQSYSVYESTNLNTWISMNTNMIPESSEGNIWIQTEDEKKFIKVQSTL